MIKQSIQVQTKVKSDQIRLHTYSSDGKNIAFIREKHELVILSQDKDYNYESNSFINNLFEMNGGQMQFIGNLLCWHIIKDFQLKIIFIDISSMKESMYSYYIGDNNPTRVIDGCLYQIIKGNLVVTDFRNESKINVFQRNYRSVNLMFCRYVPDPYLFIQNEEQLWCESIPIQDDRLFQVNNNCGPSFLIAQHHIITQKPFIKSVKLISLKKDFQNNANTFFISTNSYRTSIKTYKQLMISCNNKGVTTISKNTNQKILRNQRLHYEQLYVQNNYLQIYSQDDLYSVVDLRTSRIENYEDTKQFAIRQNRIIQFKSDSLLIHIMNS